MSKKADRFNYESTKQKTLDDFHQIEKNFKGTEREAIKEAKKKIGKDVFENYHITEDDFDYDSLMKKICNFETNGIFKGQQKRQKKCQQKCQQISVPFSQKQFNLFYNTKKKLIRGPIHINKKGKYYEIFLLEGKINGKPVAFSLTIRRPRIDDYSQLNISLDLWIKGRIWIPISRLDTSGFDHPNYYDIDGNMKKNLKDIDFVKTPHLHLNSHENEVLHYNHLEYMPSIEVDIDIKKFAYNDGAILETCMNFFSKKFCFIKMENYFKKDCALKNDDKIVASETILGELL